MDRLGDRSCGEPRDHLNEETRRAYNVWHDGIGALPPALAARYVDHVLRTSDDPERQLTKAQLVEAALGGSAIKQELKRREARTRAAAESKPARARWGRGLVASIARAEILEAQRRGDWHRERAYRDILLDDRARHYAGCSAIGVLARQRVKPTGTARAHRRSPARPRCQARSDDGPPGSDGPGDAASVLAAAVRALVPVERFTFDLLGRVVNEAGVGSAWRVLDRLGPKYESAGWDDMTRKAVAS